MDHLVVGFANIGRADNADQVRKALDKVNNALDGYDHRALFLNEIDEGDTTNPSDHELVKNKFPQYQRPDPPWPSKEPILTKGLTIKWSKTHAGCDGVPNQTPARRLGEVLVDGGSDPDVALLGAHYPAGAHNGERPPHVKDQLLEAYGQLKDTHRQRLHLHLDEGRHVIWGMDTNWPEFPPLADREKTMRHHKPDWIRVVPAPGWTVHKVAGGQIDLPIEDLHKLQWCELDFRPA